MIKIKNKLTLIVVLTFLVVLLFSMSSTAFAQSEIISSIEGATQGKFTLAEPSLDNRLTYNGTTATLFAPYTTKEGPHYDANKSFPQDKGLCWAASSSNLLAWYLDINAAKNINDVSTYERSLYGIFDNFRANFTREGYDPLQGFNWYFTGHFSTGTPPPNLTNQNSGGYLNKIKYIEDYSWAMLDAANYYGIMGNYSEKYPFIREYTSHLYKFDTFSEAIIDILKYGAAVLTVNKEVSYTGGGHAITLWGCDYDKDTKEVKYLYITDSDDSLNQLVKIKVTKKADGGVSIKLPAAIGDATPFTVVSSATMLYSPDAVVEKGTHIHNYESKTDSEYHWKECKVCGEIIDKEAHSYLNWEALDDMTLVKKCSCGYSGENFILTVSNIDLTYDDAVHNLIYILAPKDVTIEYSLNGSDFVTTIPSTKEVGEYIIRYKLLNQDNSLIKEGNVISKINKKVIEEPSKPEIEDKPVVPEIDNNSNGNSSESTPSTQDNTSTKENEDSKVLPIVLMCTLVVALIVIFIFVIVKKNKY